MFDLALSDLTALGLLIGGLGYVFVRIARASFGRGQAGAGWGSRAGSLISSSRAYDPQFKQPAWKSGPTPPEFGGVGHLGRTDHDIIVESFAGYGSEDVFGRNNDIYGN